MEEVGGPSEDILDLMEETTEVVDEQQGVVEAQVEAAVVDEVVVEAEAAEVEAVVAVEDVR